MHKIKLGPAAVVMASTTSLQPNPNKTINGAIIVVRPSRTRAHIFALTLKESAANVRSNLRQGGRWHAFNGTASQQCILDQLPGNGSRKGNSGVLGGKSKAHHCEWVDCGHSCPGHLAVPFYFRWPASNTFSLRFAFCSLPKSASTCGTFLSSLSPLSAGKKDNGESAPT